SLIAFIGFSFFGFSQTATIKGVILDETNEPIANVHIKAGENGTTTNENGFYELKIPINTDVIVEFTHLSHKRIVSTFKLKNGQEIEFNPVMNTTIEQIATVVRSEERRVGKECRSRCTPT